ncbi:uncharacterized protein LOC142976883 [Anticarsia gemmatalis]|uniref:uncharacterized protein LOC142976883 n=1 Tax=Anticarsia gemmatalis TaxID=129554 RepID=UPI003F772409
MGCILDNCCFCIELRTGSLIIGYLSLIGSIILTLMAGIAMGLSGYYASEVTTDEQRLGAGILIGITVFILIIVLLNLIFSIVLLVGLHKYKRGHVKAYLIYTGIFIGLSILLFIASVSTNPNVQHIFRDILQIGLSIYFLIVIRSYYKRMNDPENNPTVYSKA